MRMVVSRFPYAIPTLPGGKKPPFVSVFLKPLGNTLLTDQSGVVFPGGD